MNEACLSPLWVFSFAPGKYPRAKTFPYLGHDSSSEVCFVDSYSPHGLLFILFTVSFG